jgi:post-segregation antitoxin (ccd killing protein)
MPRGNRSPKLAITIDPDVHREILQQAADHQVSVSAWITEAARLELQRQAGMAAVAAWEDEHGAFTSEELQEAQRRVHAQLRAPRVNRRTA